MKTSYDLFTDNQRQAQGLTSHQETVIREALSILQGQLRDTAPFTSPRAVMEFCQLQIALERDEHFCCLFLDTRHRLIAFERLFHGTVDSASVYPRILVRRCLELNASAAIFTHNHPSGVSEPSQDDISITAHLKSALSLVDVRVLDHIVVGVGGCTSMAERGLL